MASKDKDKEDLPEIAKLSLDSAKAKSKPKKRIEVVDSWEDESDEDQEPGGVPLDSTEPAPDRSSDDFDDGQDVTQNTALPEASFLEETSPFYSASRTEFSTSSAPRSRPTTSMLVANRLIAAGTGHRIKRTEEQRKEDKKKFDLEKQRREEERRQKEEAEKAKRSVWEDD